MKTPGRVWGSSHLPWSNRPSRCVFPSCLVPWSCAWTGFDLSIQPGGVPAAGLPGSSWPPGYSDCQRQGDASQRKRHTPNKGAGLPPFMQGKHNPQAGFFFPLMGETFHAANTPGNSSLLAQWGVGAHPCARFEPGWGPIRSHRGDSSSQRYSDIFTDLTAETL